MSVKRMITKLALAFVAKKGIDMVKGMGGVGGVKSALQGDLKSTTTASASANGGLGDLKSTTTASANGGLGDLIGTLGLSSGSTKGAAGAGSIGAMIGSLATAFGGQADKPVAQNDLDAQFGASATVSDDEAGPVLRAMVQMARADGSIDEDEQSALFEILDDATADEKATLTAALREPVDPLGLAQDTPQNARKEVYSAALLIGTPDTISERQFLQSLAAGLGLEQHDLDALHSAMAKPRMQLS